MRLKKIIVLCLTSLILSVFILGMAYEQAAPEEPFKIEM